MSYNPEKRKTTRLSFLKFALTNSHHIKKVTDMETKIIKKSESLKRIKSFNSGKASKENVIPKDSTEYSEDRENDKANRCDPAAIMKVKRKIALEAKDVLVTNKKHKMKDVEKKRLSPNKKLEKLKVQMNKVKEAARMRSEAEKQYHMMAQGMLKNNFKTSTKSVNSISTVNNSKLAKMDETENLFTKKCLKPSPSENSKYYRIVSVKSPSNDKARLLKKKALVSQIKKIKKNSTLKLEVNSSKLVASILKIIIKKVIGQSVAKEVLIIDGIPETEKLNCTPKKDLLQIIKKSLPGSNISDSIFEKATTKFCEIGKSMTDSKLTEELEENQASINTEPAADNSINTSANDLCMTILDTILEAMITNEAAPAEKDEKIQEFKLNVEPENKVKVDEPCIVEYKYLIVSSILDELFAKASAEEAVAQDNIFSDNEVQKNKPDHILQFVENYFSIDVSDEKLQNDSLVETTAEIPDELYPLCNLGSSSLPYNNIAQYQSSVNFQNNTEDNEKYQEINNQQYFATNNDNCISDGNSKHKIDTVENTFAKQNTIDQVASVFSPKKLRQTLHGVWLRSGPSLKRLRPCIQTKYKAFFSSPPCKKMRSEFFFEKLSTANFFFNDVITKAEEQIVVCNEDFHEDKINKTEQNEEFATLHVNNLINNALAPEELEENRASINTEPAVENCINTGDLCMTILDAILNAMTTNDSAPAEKDEKIFFLKNKVPHNGEITNSETTNAEDLCTNILEAVLERAVSTKADMSLPQVEGARILVGDIEAIADVQLDLEEPSKADETHAIVGNILDLLIGLTIETDNGGEEVEACQELTKVEFDDGSKKLGNVTRGESTSIVNFVLNFLFEKVTEEKEENTQDVEITDSVWVASSIIDILIKASVANEASPRTLKRKNQYWAKVSKAKKQCPVQTTPVRLPNAKDTNKSQIKVKRLAQNTPLRLTRSQMKQGCQTSKLDKTFDCRLTGSIVEPRSSKDILKNICKNAVKVSLEKLSKSDISKYSPVYSGLKTPELTQTTKKSRKNKVVFDLENITVTPYLKRSHCLKSKTSDKKLQPEHGTDSLKRKLTENESASPTKKSKATPAKSTPAKVVCGAASPRLTRSARKFKTSTAITHDLECNKTSIKGQKMSKDEETKEQGLASKKSTSKQSSKPVESVRTRRSSMLVLNKTKETNSIEKLKDGNKNSSKSPPFVIGIKKIPTELGNATEKFTSKKEREQKTRQITKELVLSIKKLSPAKRTTRRSSILVETPVLQRLNLQTLGEQSQSKQTSPMQTSTKTLRSSRRVSMLDTPVLRQQLHRRSLISVSKPITSTAETKTKQRKNALSMSKEKLSTPVKKHLPKLLVVNLTDDEDEDYSHFSTTQKSPTAHASDEEEMEISIISEKLSPAQNLNRVQKVQEEIVILDSDTEDDEEPQTVLKMMLKRQQEVDKEIRQAAAKTASRSVREAQLLLEESLKFAGQPPAKTRRQSRVHETFNVAQQKRMGNCKK